MSNPTSASLRARMNDALASACRSLGITPLDMSSGSRSSATFATQGEATVFVGALERAGASDVDVHHWDPKVDTDFDRDEYQVCWS